jgi:ribosomal protein S18 acetylase RimI-like enzyme
MDSMRRAGLHDASSIAAIAIEVWLGTYLRHGVSEAFANYVLTEHSADAVRARLRSASHLLWVSENRDGINGFLQLTLGSPGPVEGCSLYEISTLYVQPRHQETGKGSGLLRACLQHVTEVGGECAWLTVNAENAGALAFYGHHGFTDVGPASFTLGGRSYENRVLMIGLPR